MFKKIKRIVLGPPRNALSKAARKHITLIAFLAWIGLGADGLSSSAYGPEQSFLMLGQHVYLGFYLAIATAITVFVISFSYNQVIELFPSGGGGYKIASSLINPYAGLVSGSALILNYALTIAVSFSSAVSALFSVLPLSAQPYKVDVAIAGILLLMYLNLRGIKESIKVFMPIFLGFVITHFFIVVYGIGAHIGKLPHVATDAWGEVHTLAMSLGSLFVISLFLNAYSNGGGTYTGLEAVANNANNLAEPRVKTGRWTMLYMAVSLSVVAGGIIFLYLLWNAHVTPGKTLNAVVFASVLQTFPYHHLLLIITLAFEAALLFVGANTGFLAGPTVLANMAVDGWVPKRFRTLSSRLVIQNGVVLYGIVAVLIVVWAHGSIAKLVILYSINVFITFSLSLFALCKHWIQERHKIKNWMRRLSLALIGFLVCSTILLITLIEKFTEGAWLTIFMTGIVIIIGYLIKGHYKTVKKQIEQLDKVLIRPLGPPKKPVAEIDPSKPTAVFFIGESIGEGMHTLLWAQRMFRKKFANFIFLSVGVVDINTYESETTLARMKRQVKKTLQYFLDYSAEQGIAAKAITGYGTDHVEKLVELAEQVSKEVKDPIFFAAKLILKKDNWLTRKLHNETPNALQRYLHLRGMQMIILPVKL